MTDTQNTGTKFILSDKLYSWGKKLVQVILPAISSLYFGLAAIWGLPAAEQVVGTLAVVATFIGVVLGISSAQYDRSGAAYDGHMVVTDPGDPDLPKMFSLQLNGDPQNLVNKDTITFKVKTE